MECRFTRRKKICCSVFAILLLIVSVLVITMGVLCSKCCPESKFSRKMLNILQLFHDFISAKDVDFEGDPWPVTDENGYYQSYKENGKWANYWHKEMPGFLHIMFGFLCNKDESQIPGFMGSFSTGESFQRELESNIPMQKPYWIKNPENFLKDGIRATWIGHATCLAEVDGSVVLTDPIFRYL